MKRFFSILLVLTFIFGLTACGTTASDASGGTLSPDSQTNESWGVSVTEVQTETTTAPEILNTVTNVTDEAEELSEEQKSELSQLLMALVMCDFADGMQYEPQNGLFFWRAMNYYAASVCYDMDALSEDMCWAVFSEDQVKSFAKRLFAESDVIPALPDIGMIEKWEDGTYAFTLGNYGDVQLELGEMKTASNGRYLMEVTLKSQEENLGVWSFEFVQLEGQYCVSGILYG